MFCPKCGQNYAQGSLKPIGKGGRGTPAGDKLAGMGLNVLGPSLARDAVTCRFCGYSASWDQYKKDLAELQEA